MNQENKHEQFMQLASQLALDNVATGRGGPFGCVIVKDDQVIATGTNAVLANYDPTAHAEVVAIRNACKTLASYQLTDCVVYTSCEPCPMCLGALYWARPDKIYFANTQQEAAAIGFDDQHIYQELELPYTDRKLPLLHLPNTTAIASFGAWVAKEDKQAY